jgi:replicative DNA helicase
MATVSKAQSNLLPHDADIERAVLGALLIDPDAMLRVQEVDLQPQDFFLPLHALVFGAMKELAERYRPIDCVTVGDLLANKQNGKEGQSQLEAIGGQAALTRLMADTVTTIYVPEYAAIVKRLSRQRRIIGVSGDVAALAQSYSGDVNTLYDEVSRLLFKAMDRPEAASHYYGTDDNLIEYMVWQDQIRERLEADPDALIVTGLRDLDAFLGDIPEGTLHVPVARPGTGKTIYCECMAEHNARRGKRVVFYHYELSTKYMLDRRICRHGGVPFKELRRGYRGAEVDRAIDVIRQWHANIIYVHCPGWSAERIAADITRLHAKGECDLAVIDYLQKIPLPNLAGLTTSMRIGQNAETLKNCAEVLGIPIVLPSQVNRSFKARGDSRPSISDIRESGEIEEKANQILVLHRPDERSEGSPEDMFNQAERIEIHIEKNTSGSTGKVDVLHVMGRYLYADVARDDPYPPDMDAF